MIVGGVFAPVQIVGYVALVLGVLAFLQKNDVRLKVLLSGEGLAYLVHFALLGNFPASGSAGLSCVRNLVSLKSRSPVWVVVFVVANLAVGYFGAKNTVEWLPVVGSSLATAAVFWLRDVPLRLVLLVSTLSWLVNNAYSGSIGGVILELFIATANLSTIARMAARKPLPGGSAAPSAG